MPTTDNCGSGNEATTPPEAVGDDLGMLSNSSEGFVDCGVETDEDPGIGEALETPSNLNLVGVCNKALVGVVTPTSMAPIE